MALVNWVYGSNWTDRSVGGNKYIIKDGVIQNGYSATGTSYATVSNSFVLTTTNGMDGVYINFNATGKSSLKFIMKANKTDGYNGVTYWNQPNKFQTYAADKEKKYIASSYTEYTLDISTYSGDSSVDIFANISSIYCTDMWLE